MEEQTNSKLEFPIVGVGASAGGLVALEAFFSNMPADTGMSFVVIQHLSKHFKSLMDELLARYTDMKIHVAENGMLVFPNTIYLIPPATYLTIENRRLILTEYESEKPIPHYPIDQFFQSLAETNGSNVAGVILSGAGSDGSEGLKSIHRAGGLVLVQSEETARFGGMPQSAIDTGLVDLVMEPENMNRVLQDFFAGKRVVPLNDGSDRYEIVTGEDAFSYILSLLQNKFKVDFNYYKIPTLARRIERRMGLAGIEDEVDYARFLYDAPDELDRLYRDMLVDVTYFFRDPEAFNYLAEHIVPEIVSRKKNGDAIRIWSAGCATGEETYSLAMIFDREIRQVQRKEIDLKVFATDLHQDSIRIAATGIFDDKQLESIPEAFRDEYLYTENDRIYVDRELRRKIIFAQHDLLKDSTFTGLDFISCRNVLIYFLPEAQHRVLTQFHFGLNMDGVLFLGPSEHLGALNDDFETVNRVWRVFSKKTARRYLDSNFLRLPRSSRVRHLPVPAMSKREKENWEQTLLTKFMPDSILVDSQWYLIRTFGNGSTYLRIPAGRVDLLITRLIVDDLITPLRGALYRASQENTPVRLTSLETGSAGGQRLVDLAVEPMQVNEGDGAGADENFFLISIMAQPLAKSILAKSETGENDDPANVVIEVEDLEYVEELERELTFTRESLQATIEELETTNEELQSANEELLAANEELQSTNEELHSVNEELYTVNSEYLARNEELTHLHEEMRELQKVTGSVILVINRDFVIKSISPAAGELFSMLPHDIGRLITDLRLFDDIPAAHFENLLKSALEGAKQESYISVSRSGKKYLMQIIPHAPNLESEYDSLIISLINVSTLEKSLNLPTAYDLALQAPVMLFIYDVEKRANVFCSEASLAVMGFTPREIQAFGANFMGELVHPEDQLRIRNETFNLEEEPDGTVLDKRFRIRHKDGRWIWVLSREMVYKRNDEGRLTQFVGAAIDISEEVTAKTRIEFLEAEISRLKDEGVGS